MADVEIRHPRRKELIRALQRALGIDFVCPTAWACLWLADIEKLEELVDDAKRRPVQVKAVLGSVEDPAKLVQKWMHRNKKRKTEDTAQQSRSASHRALAMQRDSSRCVITKGSFQVAHIVPYAMRNETDMASQHVSFWDSLRCFWSAEKVQAWHDAVFPHGTESCANLICLSHNAHHYWSQPYFALRPLDVAEDKTEMQVEFWWLQTNKHDPSVKLVHEPVVSTSSHGAHLARLWDHETLQMIRSGTKLTITTDDPATKPLPSFELLELQWYLHRVASMSGAMDNFVNDDNEDDEDDGLKALTIQTLNELSNLLPRRFPQSRLNTSMIVPLVGAIRGGEGENDEEEEKGTDDKKR